MRNNTLQNRLIGKRLRAIRQCANVSRKELGAYLGLTHQQISKYENGDNEIKFQTMVEIAGFLNANIMDFIVDENGEVIESNAQRAVYQLHALNSPVLQSKFIDLIECINTESTSLGKGEAK